MIRKISMIWYLSTLAAKLESQNWTLQVGVAPSIQTLSTW